jgi:hypothetical protein
MEEEMEWHQAVLELSELNGKSVCVTVGEKGGAGAQVASFSGTLRLGEPEDAGSEDEMLPIQIGNTGTVVIGRSLLEGAERQGRGVRIGQATVYLDFEDLSGGSSDEAS